MKKLINPITLMIVAILSAIVVIMCANANTPKEKVITFADENLYIKVKEALKDKVIECNNEAKTIKVNVNEIEYISISGAQIKDFSGLEQFDYLKDLNISNNVAVKEDNEDDIKITSYSKVANIDKLGKLSRLENLGLRYCQIDDDELDFLKELDCLKKLDLDYNNITDINKIPQINKLEDLSVTNNNIEDISALEGSSKIKLLYISGNKIKDITAIKNLTQLDWLEISDNMVSDISVVSNFKKLRKFKANNNKIEDISALEKVRSLEEIEVAGNRIEDFSCLMELPNLKLNDEYITNIGKQNIVINVKDGDSVYLPPVVKQSFEMFTTTKTIDCINCETNEDYSACEIKPGVEGARIRISDGSFENTIITFQISDKTDDAYKYTGEKIINNQKKNEEVLELPKIPVIIGSVVVGLVLLISMAFVIFKK